MKMSKALVSLWIALGIALFWALVTGSMGIIADSLGWPGWDDPVQGLVVFLTSAWSAITTYKLACMILPFSDRHRMRALDLAKYRISQDPYRVSNLLSSGDIPSWLFVKYFWSKFLEKTHIEDNLESVKKFLIDNKINFSENSPEVVLKQEAIDSQMQNPHLVDLLIPNGCEAGEHLTIFVDWWHNSAKDLSLDEIDKLLGRLGDETMATIATVEGTDGCHIVRVSAGKPSPWVLNSREGVNLMAGTKPSFVEVNGNLSVIQGLRVAIDRSAFKAMEAAAREKMVNRLFELVPLFTRKEGGVVLTDAANQMTGFFIYDHELTEDELVSTLHAIAQFAREFWPAKIEEASETDSLE